jgi:hypothetical protein
MLILLILTLSSGVDAIDPDVTLVLVSFALFNLYYVVLCLQIIVCPFP